MSQDLPVPLLHSPDGHLTDRHTLPVAVSTGYMGVDLLASTARSAPPECTHAKLASYGRMIPSVCGLLLFIMCLDYKMRLALGPLAPGTITTAVVWMAIGIAFNPRNRRSWMGSASNGLSTTTLPEAR